MKLLSKFALFTLFACPLMAQQYVAVKVGSTHSAMTNETHNPKMGYHAGAHYGYIFGNGFRSEIEFRHQKNNFKTKYTLGQQDVVQSKEYRSLQHLAYMVNVLYDIAQIRVGDFTPYIGIGAGYCQHTEKNKVKFLGTTSQDKMRDDRFAYQGIVGAKYQINADYATAIQYHYFCGQPHKKDHSVGVSLIRNF